MTVAFAHVVVLTRDEVFDALEACAAGEAALARLDRHAEAQLLGMLFELLEDRVTVAPLAAAVPINPSAPPARTRATGS